MLSITWRLWNLPAKKTQLKSAQGQLTSAQGKYDGATAQLAYSEIRSPIDGVVTERPLYQGETAPAGSPLLAVMDTSSVIARAHIPQLAPGDLKAGNAATVTLPGGVEVNGKVTLVSPALDPNSTTVEVWVSVPNRDGSLRPGTAATVEILARTVNDAIVVPVVGAGENSRWCTRGDDRRTDGKAHQVERRNRHSRKRSVANHKRIAWWGDSHRDRGSYGLPDNTKVKIAEAPLRGRRETCPSEKPAGEKDQ